MPYWFDGNNLIGQSAAIAAANPQARKAFLSTLCDAHKSGGGRFIVYFDGDDPGDAPSLTGVAVRFSAPLSADEAICRRLRESQNPSEIIIVTNDQALALRCRNADASVVNWQSFESKMRNRKVQRSAKNNSGESIDVDEWARYFGLKKCELEK